MAENIKEISIDLRGETSLNDSNNHKEIRQKITYEYTGIKLKVTGDASSSVCYITEQQDGSLTYWTDISFDEQGVWNKAINITYCRNSTIVARFKVNDALHTVLTLLIDPPRLDIESVLFCSKETQDSNHTHVFSGESLKMSVTLSREVVQNENALLQYKAYIKEPGESAYSTVNGETKAFLSNKLELKPGNREVILSFAAPPNLSGAKIAVSFFLRSAVKLDESATQPTVRYYTGIARECQKIDKVYWSMKEELEPVLDAKSRVIGYKHSALRREICNNEDGFLHIHTKQMYGEKVKVSVYERDRTGDDALIISRDALILDNVACVVFSMQELLPTLRSRRNAWFEGQNYDLVAKVEPANKGIKSQEGVAPLYLKKEEKSFTPAKSTIDGIYKFIIGLFKDSEEEEKKKDCGGKFCITKANYKEKNAGKLIQEINIRLAGFGGNVPTEEFDDRTEAVIKQFQRDYMKVAETGKICGSLLSAIDEFCKEYPIPKANLKCPNCSCGGFGSGKYPEQKGQPKIEEKNRKYEYPGIHRSLMWGLRAILFYLHKESNIGYSFDHIESGYRCWINNKIKNRTSTNHMGKAVDLHFNRSKRVDMERIRDKIIIPKMNAQIRWSGVNKFSLEPTVASYSGEYVATSWIHIDVRTFEIEYLADEFFVKTQAGIDGKNLISLANELKLSNICNCQNWTLKKMVSTQSNIIDKRVDPKTLKTSEQGKSFIKSWEGLRLQVYNDSQGYATIGYGHLIVKESAKTAKISAEFKNGITKKKADELFSVDLERFEEAVKRDIIVPLYQYEFDALVSLLYNCGQNFLSAGNAPKLYGYLKSKNYNAAADEFSDITRGGTGLKERRQDEINIFKNNIYKNHR